MTRIATAAALLLATTAGAAEEVFREDFEHFDKKNGIEPWGDWGKHPPPGVWNFYSYLCEMKGSPDGKYWGQPRLVRRSRRVHVVHRTAAGNQ